MKKRNRILAFILAIIMVMTALPLSVAADDIYLPEVEQEIVIPGQEAPADYPDDTYYESTYEPDDKEPYDYEAENAYVPPGSDAVTSAVFSSMSDDAWIEVAAPNSNNFTVAAQGLLTNINAVLVRDFGQTSGEYDYSVVRRLRLTGPLGMSHLMNLGAVRDTLSPYLEELDLSGTSGFSIPISNYPVLRKVILPSGINASGMIAHSPALETVIVSGNINSFGSNGFFTGADSLREIIFMGDTAPTIHSSTFFAARQPVAYVPDKTTGGYELEAFRQHFSEVRNIDNTPEATRDQLQAKIDEAKALSEQDYTPESFSILQAAINSAIGIVSDPNSSGAQIYNALQALQQSINLLVIRSETITFFEVTKGAEFGVFRKGSRHFAPFESFELIRDEQRSCDEYDVFAAENLPLNVVLHLEASIPGETVKYARLFRLAAHGTVMTVNLTALSEWVPVDNAHQNANFYSNLDDTGTVNIAPGEEFILDMFRVWQTVTSVTENYFIEPNFTIEILGDSGSIRVEPIGSPGRERFSIVGVSPGVAVLKVTYDPLEFTQLNGTTRRYNAIDPRNTGAIVVNVGSSGNFHTGITARNDYDTFYFNAAAGYYAFTFTPAAGSTVRVHDPLNISSWGSGWTDYTPNLFRGDVTVRLKDGRNIIEVTNRGVVRYHVVKARGVDVVIINATNPGQPFEIGDTARISIRGIASPVEKVAGIYNPGFNDPFGQNLATFLSLTDGSRTFNSNRSGQYTVLTHNFVFDYTISSPGTVLTGHVYGGMMGSVLNAHRNIPAEGVPANFNAVGRGPYPFGGISITIGDVPDRLDITPQMYNALSHLRAFITNPTVGNEWAVLALARARVNDDAWYARYIANLNAAITAGNISAEWSTHVGITLALTALGYDAANFNGHDMTAAFRTYIPFGQRPAWSQTVNADIFALIALDSGNYAGDRDRFIARILAEEKPNGGWGFAPVDADVDLTAMAIQALAPYYSNSRVRTAVDRGVAWLRTQTIESAESIAQVIVAFSALGLDAEYYVSSLLRYYDSSAGAFRWGHAVNMISTEQAAYALVAYDRFINNAASLYDMSDAEAARTRILPVNRAALNFQIGIGTGHLRSNFTAESWNIMYAALITAREVHAQTDSTQAEVDNARDSLRDAIAGLVLASAGGGNGGNGSGNGDNGGNGGGNGDNGGNGGGSSGNGGIGNNPTVFISVRDDNARPGQTRIFFAGDYFEIVPGETTVFDVLRRTGLSVQYSGRSNYGIYVEMINGFGEFSDGPLSGWMYRVNGVFPRRSAADYVLHGGERIEWLFTRDLGRDIGDTISGGQTGGANITDDDDDEDDDDVGAEVGAEVNNGVAVADIPAEVVNELIANSKEEQVSTIVISITDIENSNRIKANFAADSIRNMVRSGLNLTLVSDIVSLAFSLGALETIAETIEEDEIITISFERLEEYDGSVIIEITVFVGDVQIRSFGGYITISVPFAPAEDLTSEDYDLLTVYYSNGDDLQEMQDVKYDGENGVMIFTTDRFSRFILSEWRSPFMDVSRDDWFFRAVRFVYSNELMAGMSGGMFAPDVRISRGMVVSVLWRSEGSPDSEGGMVFHDVSAGDWYADAVAWASTNGIVVGHGNGLFGAHDEVTREQLARILYNYANWKNIDTATENDISNFNDSTRVSPWAVNAMAWANSKGFITGRTLTTIAPHGDVNRAEIAVILQMLLM